MERDAFRPKTVLVVDDDRSLCGILSRLLRQEGYQVLQALDLSRRYGHRIDVLVADIAMPGLSGPNLAQVLKQEQPNLKLLFISGLVSEQNFQGVLGGTYLRKPFLPRALVRKVHELLASIPSA